MADVWKQDHEMAECDQLAVLSLRSNYNRSEALVETESEYRQADPPPD